MSEAKTMSKYQGFCPECGSDDWDWANVGVPLGVLCVNCGYIYQSINKKEELTMGQRVVFNIEYKGIWLEVHVKRGQSALDGKHWVYTQEVKHADENITPIMSALEFSQIDHIIEQELNTK